MANSPIFVNRSLSNALLCHSVQNERFRLTWFKTCYRNRRCRILKKLVCTNWVLMSNCQSNLTIKYLRNSTWFNLYVLASSFQFKSLFLFWYAKTEICIASAQVASATGIGWLAAYLFWFSVCQENKIENKFHSALVGSCQFISKIWFGISFQNPEDHLNN